MDTDFSGWRVLAVDDEPDNLKLIADLLEFKGASVCRAQNGREGLELLAGFEPTLVLLDLAMPGIDGWEMHRQLRQRRTLDRVPIVALTALAMPEDTRRVLEAGFDGYITKPFRFNDLLDNLVAIVHTFSTRDRRGGGGDE
jgi:CheY-like chemotaxis protein